ncbi:MAG: GIY-YIG nuclease family protein [Bacteroidia bacterium]|nr:GIY-YIG nuclease family protein [Bacteroidia bacterium]
MQRFYTGSCKDFNSRFQEHKKSMHPTSFTSKADDWEEFLVVSDLQYKQARNMESHIKKMNSAKYIANLRRFPEIIEKLKARYNY